MKTGTGLRLLLCDWYNEIFHILKTGHITFIVRCFTNNQLAIWSGSRMLGETEEKPLLS